jgi:hypothetical protein
MSSETSLALSTLSVPVAVSVPLAVSLSLALAVSLSLALAVALPLAHWLPGAVIGAVLLRRAQPLPVAVIVALSSWPVLGRRGDGSRGGCGDRGNHLSRRRDGCRPSRRLPRGRRWGRVDGITANLRGLGFRSVYRR